jgi:hypothetical protein
MNKKFFMVSAVVCFSFFLVSSASAMKPGTRYKKVPVPENFYDNKTRTVVKKCKVDSVYCDKDQPQGNPVSNQVEGCIDAAGDNDGFITDWEVNRYGPTCN